MGLGRGDVRKGWDGGGQRTKLPRRSGGWCEEMAGVMKSAPMMRMAMKAPRRAEMAVRTLPMGRSG